MREELAWAAGFFDGEGCFSLVKGGVILKAEIGQVDRYVLDRFCAAIGVGKVYGPYTNEHQGKYRWDASGFESAQHTLATLWTFLSPIKRAQGAAMLKSFHASDKRRHRHVSTRETQEIVYLRGEGFTQQEIADVLGLTQTTVGRVIQRKGISNA